MSKNHFDEMYVKLKYGYIIDGCDINPSLPQPVLLFALTRALMYKYNHDVYVNSDVTEVLLIRIRANLRDLAWRKDLVKLLTQDIINELIHYEQTL